MSQASIFEIPYADQSFDVVFCHRVLQHTPDPVTALRSVAAKVKPGGQLFVHSYKASWRYRMDYKYKYRWLTRRLPRRWILAFVDRCGGPLHRFHQLAHRYRLPRVLAWNFVPFERVVPNAVAGGDLVGRSELDGLSPGQLLDVAKLITFDALTPAHDHPMSSRTFFATLAECGFEIIRSHDPQPDPSGRRRGVPDERPWIRSAKRRRPGWYATASDPGSARRATEPSSRRSEA